MNQPWWASQAEALKYGQKRKIKCCGNSPSMIIEKSRTGLRAFCFRSADHGGFIPIQLSLADLEQYRREIRELTSKPYVMPSLTGVAASSGSMSWLLKAGIGERLWTIYGIGYAEKLDRCVIPVTWKGSTTGFIARSLDPRQQPKYLTRFKDDKLKYFYSRDLGGPARHKAKLETGLDLVLTEDALSAIRVGEQVQSAGLLGTTLGGREAQLWSDLALCDNPTIGLWLDPDAAGKRKRTEIRRQLILMGADVRIINSDRDPKYYNDDQILEFLKG